MNRYFITLVLVSLVITIYAEPECGEEERKQMKNVVREPVVAGSFYPEEPSDLRKTVEKYFKRSDPKELKGEVMALVSPHAGYVYSGPVAAYGYKLISGSRYRTVVVISPSHTEYFGFSSVFNGRAYVTPLGEILVDTEVATRIASADNGIRLSSKGHLGSPMGRGEHSLEVQLPFLQAALGDFKLVPIVMGDQSEENVNALAAAISSALENVKGLIVASSDLSHFHDGKTAKRLDQVFVSHLKELDSAGLYEALAAKETEACGGGPVIAAIRAATRMGADSCRILNYAHSGNVTGDNSNVVGYVSAAIFRSPANAGEELEASEESGASGSSASAFESRLTSEDQVFLLKLARSAIISNFDESVEPPDVPESAILREKRGAFVTLRKDGRLRGCIGYIEAVKPLWETIFEMAEAAAFKDYRFDPVKASEVDDLSIEISVLSPIRELEDPSKVSVGDHGLIITRGANRGLLLPQVPTEWGWEREEFLGQTCLKAGLPRDSWKMPGTRIEVFTADIFSERELGLR